MEKKNLYVILAVIIAVVIIAAAIGVFLYKPATTSTLPNLVSVTSSTQLATVGSSVQFTAKVTGNVKNISWNFGDGTTGTGLVVNHTYTSPGRYLVFVNATGPDGYSNNLKSLWSINVVPQEINPAIASKETEPIITFNTTANPDAPIIGLNSTLFIEASYLEPPTAENWSMAYYVINFGDEINNVTPVYYNTSSGNFMHTTFEHVYKKTGFYILNLSIITYNESFFANKIVTNNLTDIQYLPSSYYSQVLSSQHYSVSYLLTIFVKSPGQSVGILKMSGTVPNPGIINVAEVQPGGPDSIDPSIEYEVTGMEVICNVYETLIAYNGSHTSLSSLFPMVAKEIPTVENGGISPDHLNYTFYIRSGLKFANGDPLTVYDVYMSFVRSLLFVQGAPGTPDWIIAQDLLPGGGFAPGLFTNGTALYSNITRALTYDNVTQSITFHLLKPDPAFLYYLADPLGASIQDYKWLVEHGAGITFTPSGFLNYTQFSISAHYNRFLQYNAMGSGPFMIGSILVGQSILLVPNPNYTPIPNVTGYNHAPVYKVYIQWLKDPETALMMLKSSQADIYVGLPQQDYPTVASLQSKGLINVYSFPTFGLGQFMFNFDINETLLSSIGSGYHIPQHYFANLDVRRAFAFAFNYDNYINNIVGNAIYGNNFSFHYTGAIPLGMPGYISPSQMRNDGVVVPYYNLTLAKNYLIKSGQYNVSINIPVIVWAGDPVDYAAASMWAEAMHSIDPNIQMTPMYMSPNAIIGYWVPGQDPMPINIGNWWPDFPFPSDYIIPYYYENGFWGAPNGWNPQLLNQTGYSDQAIQDAQLNNYISLAENTDNYTLALHYYDLADEIGVNLTFYVYLGQQNSFWYYAPWMKGVEYEENPMFGAGGDTIYIYLSK